MTDDDWSWLLRDCGDSGCVFRDRDAPSGQHTNGGCQHLKFRGPEVVRAMRLMAQEILRLQARLDELDDRPDC